MPAISKNTFLIFVLGVCGAFSAVGIAWAEKPVVVEPGNLIFTFNGGFKRKSLPTKTFAPIVLDLEGKIQTSDGTQPPPLTEFILEADKNLAIDVRRYPTCSDGLQGSRDTRSLEAACRTSILGRGSMAVSVGFAEQAPIPAVGPVVILNGGTKGGVTTLYVHTYLTQPITTTIVTKVKISRIHNGRFGTTVVATIPPIANYAGSITSFNLTINKDLKLRGKPFSMLNGKCPDRHLNTHILAIFKDGTKAEAGIARPCTGLER